MLDAERHPLDAEGGAAAPAPPSKTTFPNGRMTAKEAWVYCTEICRAVGSAPPTLRSFKWYLKHGEAIESELVPDPFGEGERVHSIATGAVVAFVEKLRSGDLPTGPSSEEKGPPESRPPPPAETKVPVACRPALRAAAPDVTPKSEQRELDIKGALGYLHTKVGRNCELNQTTFGFYLAYDLIPSEFKRRHRVVRQRDLDAFLELAPDGVYANQLAYHTDMDPSRGDLTMQEAYAYYASIDPNPIALNSFRSLVAAGIIQPIRTANDPKAPVQGFAKQEINAFLALRQRIFEQNRELPSTKSFLTRKASQVVEEKREAGPVAPQAVERARPKLDATREEAKKNDAPEEKTEGQPPALTPVPDERWATVSEAYAYYQRQAPSPLSLSWFRAKIYGKSGLFRVHSEKDSRSRSGIAHKVDLDSIDSYLATPCDAGVVETDAVRVAERTPSSEEPAEQQQERRSWPVEKAYYKFRRRVPPSMSLLQFKRLVREGEIPSVLFGDVVYVHEDAVEEHFRGHPDLDPQRPLPIGTAYSYYCSNCPDPVAPSHFKRWVTSGRLAGGEEGEDGLWTISMAHVDVFLSENPSGRMRSSPSPSTSETPAVSAAAASTRGRVTLSISSYPSPEAMAQALSLLTAQGFEVEVKP